MSVRRSRSEHISIGHARKKVCVLHKVAITAAFLATVAVIVATGPAFAFIAYDNTPRVVLRIDDGRASWRQPFQGLGGMSALDYCKLKRIPITWAVVTDWASNKYRWNPPPLSWSELIGYINSAGGELASHSVRHQPEASQSDYIRELVNSKAEIEARAPGFSCKTFIQPGVWRDEAYLDSFTKLNLPIAMAIKANYSQSMAYIGGGWTIGGVYHHYGFSPNICLDRGSCPSLAAVLATLDIVAATPGCVFILYGHGIQEVNGRNSGDICADVLKTVVDYLADLRDQGKVRLVSLNEACSAAIDPSVNRLSDGDLEVVKPGSLNPVGPVSLTGGAYIAERGGIDDSRCAVFPSGQISKVQWRSWLAPGRYKVSWWQKLVAGSSAAGLYVGMSAYGSGNPSTWPVRYKLVQNSQVGSWEHKEIYVLIPSTTPDVGLFFQQSSASSVFYLDRASMTFEPLDPSQSPTGTQVAAVCGQYVVSWNTPSDPQVTRIVVRFDTHACPVSPADGSAFGDVETVPGVRQSLGGDIVTSPTGFVYFSVFGVRSDGSYVGPDVSFIACDTTPPTQPQLSVGYTDDGRLRAAWTTSDPESGICEYAYGLGTSREFPNVTGWLSTQDSETTFSKLPSGILYLLVMAKNNIGLWSQVSSIQLPTAASVFSQADGAQVVVSGIITAKFGDCFYIRLDNSLRGIKILGNTTAYEEGAYVTVSGTLVTVDGERAVLITP
ncbi:MAG: hypothetical protein QHI38_08585 [Armatimonadota bacterium]|nr:hypothetical protein [Armatimonadota bacterium]